MGSSLTCLVAPRVISIKPQAVEYCKIIISVEFTGMNYETKIIYSDFPKNITDRIEILKNINV